jgi:nitrate/nitrite-specific signal transduction histidine kinase
VTYIALFVMVYLISLTLTRPIVRLTNAAQRIAEGDYEQDLATTVPRFPDEISSLAKVFGLMASKVYQREQSLRRQVEELKIEIDEAKRHVQVSEIVESDFFQDLQARSRALRQRRNQAQAGEGDR